MDSSTQLPAMSGGFESARRRLLLSDATTGARRPIVLAEPQYGHSHRHRVVADASAARALAGSKHRVEHAGGTTPITLLLCMRKVSALLLAA